MLPYEIILKKRTGQHLNRAEIEEFIIGYVQGRIPDYQLAALLMAIFFQGMTAQETADLTEIMIDTGVRFQADSGRSHVDKHSTGGVGDKVSIPLIPLLACCGVAVPMISGRGLGHTGGTLDKIESIPGFRTLLTEEEFTKQVRQSGMALAAQTDRLVPADKKMYALRDVTATVDSIPLISASIMSKKIAEGLNHLVLDVKTGLGAFMKDLEQAETLARSMVAIGTNVGLNIRAVISDMNQPLGFAIGNATEINESIELLRGAGPPDLIELTLTLGAHLLHMAEIVPTLNQGQNMLQEKIESGEAMLKFKELIEIQGGNPGFLDTTGYLPVSAKKYPLKAGHNGFITRLEPTKLGFANTQLGGGRLKTDDDINHAVGIILRVKLGDYVHTGDEILELLYDSDTTLHKALPYVEQAIQIQEEPVTAAALVREVIEPQH